jgi:hypothetical protein
MPNTLRKIHLWLLVLAVGFTALFNLEKILIPGQSVTLIKLK